MGWTRAAWAGCLAPLLGGCLGVHHSGHDRVAEAGVVHSEQAIARHIHRKAHEAWQVVRCEFPSKTFTAEFHDGFIDGYSDYLDRGGDGQPPAVPPLRYTQNRKYYSPEGHVLMRDYFLGFKYGTDVAIASGQRQYLTVPVLIPEKTEILPAMAAAALPGPPAVIPPPGGSDSPVKPAPQPLPLPRTVSRTPAPRPNHEGLVGSPAPPPRSQFDLPPALMRDELGLPPIGAIPALPTDSTGPQQAVPMLPAGMDLSTPAIPMSVDDKAEPTMKFPAPRDDGPDRPLGPPLAPNFEEFRPLPPNHTIPPPLPIDPPEPDKK
jgi:hypothetical protein